jgi:hypothetical protein
VSQVADISFVPDLYHPVPTSFHVSDGAADVPAMKLWTPVALKLVTAAPPAAIRTVLVIEYIPESLSVVNEYDGVPADPAASLIVLSNVGGAPGPALVSSSDAVPGPTVVATPVASQVIN